MRAVYAILMAILALGTLAAAADKDKDKGKLVDSGVFAISINGQRVATESFEIHQGVSSSVITSEVKAESAEGKSAQRSELQVAPNGELRRYEWRELSPGKAQIIVEPREGFLIEKIVPAPPEKPAEMPFLVPPSSLILDDYFFSHREVLAWRYLAQVCAGDVKQCRPVKAQFGVLIPRQRTPMLVTLEYAGLEKVTLRGSPQELNRINMKTEDAEWVLYLDSELKLVRIVVPAAKTEVDRE